MDNKLNTVDLTFEPEPINKNMLIKAYLKDSSGKKRKVSEDLFNSGQKNNSGKNTTSKNHSNRKVKSTQMSSNIKLMDKEPNVATKINFDVYDSLCASPDSDDQWGQNEEPKLKDVRSGSFCYAQNFGDLPDLSNCLNQKQPSPELSPINDKRNNNFENEFTLSNLYGTNDNVKYEQKFTNMQKNLVNCKTGYSFENQTKTNKDQSLDSLGHNNYELSYGFVSNTSVENEAKKNEPKGIYNLFSKAKFSKNTQDAEKNDSIGVYDLFTGAKLPKQNEVEKNEPIGIYNLFTGEKLPNNTQDTKPPIKKSFGISDFYATSQIIQKPIKENTPKEDSFIIKKISFNENRSIKDSENFVQHSMSFGDLNSVDSSVANSKNSIQNANTNLFDSGFPINLPSRKQIVVVDLNSRKQIQSFDNILPPTGKLSFDNRLVQKIDFSKNQAPQTLQINNSEFLKKRSIESEDSITNLLANKKRFEPQLRKNFSFNKNYDKDLINSEIKPKVQNKNIEITSSLLFSNNFETTNERKTSESKSISFTFNGKSGHNTPLSRTDDKCNKNVAVNTLKEKKDNMECESTSLNDNNLTASHLFSIQSPKNGPDSNFKSFFDSKPNTGKIKDEFESVSERTISNPIMSSQKTVNCINFSKGSEKKAVVGQHQINFTETKVLNLFNQPENFTKYSFNMGGSRTATHSIPEVYQTPTPDKKTSFSDGKRLSLKTPEKKLDPKQFYFDKTYLNTIMYDAKFNDTATNTSTVRSSDFDNSLRASPISNINANLILSEKFIFDTKDVTKAYKPNYLILLQKMKQEYLNCFQNQATAILKNGINVKTRLDILVEMSAICEDLYFKRETFYVSVNIFDRC